jgi:glycerol-3-phosphate dehydrogenase (NAD(P)+)
MRNVAEGVLTSRSAHELAKKVGVECHIIEGIYKVCPMVVDRLSYYSTAYSIHLFLKVIHENADPLEIVASNMSRPLHSEVSPIVAEAYRN